MRIEFETTEFLFTRSQMPQAQVDTLMQLWAASMLPHNDCAPFTDHRDLHRVIDAISLGDVPWQSVQVQHLGEIPENGAPSWMQKSYDVWFRDPNAIVKNLLSNLDFNNHFDYVPYREFEPSGQRHWENMMSGNWVWNHVVCQHQQNSTFHVQSFGRSHKQSSFYTQTRYVKGLFLVQRRSGENFR